MSKKLLGLSLPLPIFACGPTIGIEGELLLIFLAVTIVILFIVGMVKYFQTKKLRFLFMTIPLLFIILILTSLALL